MTKMNPDVKKLWVDALNSGNYKQGIHNLRDRDDNYCCLGVLCELAIQAGVPVERTTDDTRIYKYTNRYLYDNTGAALPLSVVDWAGLNSDLPVVNGESLSSMNDSGVSFIDIAKAIEEGL